jgi:hypothetical protein
MQNNASLRFVRPTSILPRKIINIPTPFKQAGSLAVPDGYRPATFGVLELPSKRFRVFQAADGVQAHGLVSGGGMHARSARVGKPR